MRVFFDGLFTTPRLDHPECVAVHSDGSIWCGGEAGQIYRITPDGSSIEQIATTSGFILGIAFNPTETALYACDIAHRAVFHIDLASGEPTVFADGFRNPNYPVFDASGRLYVSDSHPAADPGPPIYRYDPDGTGGVWSADPLNFANGLALRNDALYVAESFLPGVSRIEILPDGSPGARTVVATLPGTVPDGLGFGPDGDLYIACYEPSQILRLRDGQLETVAHDPTAHTLCHPTNIAFRGTTVFTANLGRWHITALDL